MKNALYILILCAFLPFTSNASDDELEKFVGHTKLVGAALSDVHFCAMVGQNKSRTWSVNKFIEEDMNCEEEISVARDSGASEQEVYQEVRDAFQKSILNKLEDCAREKMIGNKNNCYNLVKKTKSLGVSHADILEELGVLSQYIK